MREDQRRIVLLELSHSVSACVVYQHFFSEDALGLHVSPRQLVRAAQLQCNTYCTTIAIYHLQ